MESIARLTDQVLAAGFVLSLVLGFVLHRSHFCTMGAISDWLLMGSSRRARQWALATAVAVLGFGGLTFLGAISPLHTIYNTSALPWLSYALGGVFFGAGMVLASGCLSKSLVRLGGGNLKALVVILVAGVSAMATMRGLPGVLRVRWLDPVALDWGAGPFLAQWWGRLSGQALPEASLLVALLVGGALLLWSLWNRDMRDAATILGGVTLGLLVVALWGVSGVLGWVPEHPETLESIFVATASARMESMSFTAPLGYWVDAFMYFSDGSKRLQLGMVLVPGVLIGSFASAVLQGQLRVEGFVNVSDLIRHLLGGVLMGMGGVMAMGCTVGQGLSGLSTLNLGSVLVVAAIVLGASLTLQWQWRHAKD